RATPLHFRVRSPRQEEPVPSRRIRALRAAGRRGTTPDTALAARVTLLDRSQLPDPEVLRLDHRALVVLLDGDVAALVLALGVHVVDEGHAVDRERDVHAAGLVDAAHAIVEPGVGRDERGGVLDEVV